MEHQFGDKLSELDLTNDEVKRLSECMKDEKFIDLLRDYAMEISNPENKKKYEEEISMLEQERGNNVTFIHPTPGHVLKTSCDGQQKCFINICSSPQVGKPVNKPTVKGSTRGMQWSIPHSLSQPREDIDKAGVKCMVYDVVFHPDTYHMTRNNARFLKMIHDTALDAVGRLFHVTLDKVNVKTPKMKFKGLPKASIIRTPTEATRELDASGDTDDPLKFPYPPMSNGEVNKDADSTKANNQKPLQKEVPNSNSDKSPDFVEPRYTLTHRGYFDMKDFYTVPDYNIVSTRPRELILNVDLPMLKAASALQLEIFEDRVFLECAKPVKYKLDLKLPYPVDDSKGHARFDKSKRKLSITLEVLPPKIQQALKLSKLVQEKSDNACGSCSREEEINLPENQEDERENAEDYDPSENIVLPSDHPSGLLHGRSKCRHQNHGALWGKDYEEASTDHQDLGFLHKVSPLLVDKLADRLTPKITPEFLGKARPQIFYHQDETFVTIIVNVKCIEGQKLWYVVSPDNLQFSCVSEESRQDLIYQLYVEFQNGEIVDPRRSRVDVSDDNAVFLLRKHVTSEHEWQTFDAGFDSLTLKKLSFATESNVNNLITSVKTEAQNGITREFECEDVSSTQNSELLALKLLPKEIVDEIRLSIEEKENGTVVDELPILEESLERVCNIQEKLGKDAIIDYEKGFLKAVNSRNPQTPEADSETDEDDDSDTCETADSSEDYSQKHEVEHFKVDQRNAPDGKEDLEKEPPITKISSQKNPSQSVITAGDMPLLDGQKKVADVSMSSGAQPETTKQPTANEPLVFREYDKSGNEGKTTVVTDHKTVSVIQLSNEMLFEIDSD